MASEHAESFMRALQEAEETGSVDPLVNFFNEDSELWRLTGDKHMRGVEGANQFWREYLSAFRHIRSKFTNVIEDGNRIVLEWISDAEPETAEPFQYEGVSILEMDGDKVHRFRTYYDSVKFTQTMAKSRG